jgi:hypothetical protein
MEMGFVMKMMMNMSQLIDLQVLNFLMKIEKKESKELKQNYKLKQMLNLSKAEDKMNKMQEDSRKNLRNKMLIYNNKSMLLKLI